MRNIYFTGLKHSGKTLFARLLGEETKRECYDLDREILISISPMEIREYYTLYGLSNFQKKEEEAFDRLIKNNNYPFILSLGGGASDNAPLMEKMKKTGIILYLKREENELLENILKSGIPPFLDRSNLSSSFHLLYTRRDRIYSSYADIVIPLGSFGDKEEKLDLITKALKEAKYE